MRNSRNGAQRKNVPRSGTAAFQFRSGKFFGSGKQLQGRENIGNDCVPVFTKDWRGILRIG
jgi:hypothetical protein